MHKLLALFAAVLISTVVVGSGVAQAQSSGPLTITTAGTTLVAPDVRCTGDPVPDPLPWTKGITIKASNVTIYNPHVENCQAGISIE